MHENRIGTHIVNSAFEVHTQLGSGLLESAYQKCLLYELKKRELRVLSEVQLPIKYKEAEIDCAYRLDLIVENKVIVEIKSVESLLNIHTAQLITYLKLTNCKLGYLLNFNSVKIKYGIKRIVNNLD